MRATVRVAKTRSRGCVLRTLRTFVRYWKLFAAAFCLGFVLLAISLPPGADEMMPKLRFIFQEAFRWQPPLQFLRGCNCTRPYLWPPSLPNLRPLNSTCSDEGTFHRPLQNVISFSLRFLPYYTRNELLLAQYVEGLELNINASQTLYPNFTFRIYTDHQLTPEDPFCRLLCLYSHVFWCDMRNNSWVFTSMFYMMWRFLPLGDPTVDVFLSRDLDSVITPREAAAVWDWLKNQGHPPRGIHVMRDNAAHSAPMMGGMWGARNSWLHDPQQLHQSIFLKPKSESLERMVKTIWSRKGGDQMLISRYIYHQRRDEILVHASYHCGRESENQTRPFPIRRRGPVPGKPTGFTDFVGNTGLGRDVYLFRPCPKRCRPSYEQNWTYC